MTTPIEKVKNFGPVTSIELRTVGIETLERLQTLGAEVACSRWIEAFPERLNANAFLGVVCALEGVVWTRATSQHKKEAQALVNRFRAEYGMPVKRSKR